MPKPVLSSEARLDLKGIQDYISLEQEVILLFTAMKTTKFLLTELFMKKGIISRFFFLCQGKMRDFSQRYAAYPACFVTSKCFTTNGKLGRQ
jgi:hypothetical protein